MQYYWWDDSPWAREERDRERQRRYEDRLNCEKTIAKHKKMMERREFLKKHGKVTVSVRKNFIIKKEEVDEEPIKTEKYRAKKPSFYANPPVNKQKAREIRERRRRNFVPLKDHIDHSLTP